MRLGEIGGGRRVAFWMAMAVTLSGLMSIGSTAAVAQVQAETSNSSNATVPAGFPGGAYVVSTGNSMVAAVESSAQFRALADGVTYHIDQGRSFGYTWGANIAATERIIFFSPNGSGQIEADIYVQNGTIQQLLFANVTSSLQGHFSASADWGGYEGQYCGGTILGVCTGYSKLSESYGNVQVPNNIGAPGSGVAGNGCCAMGEWTGVANSSGGGSYLTQGGVAWAGDHWSFPHANANGYALFVQELTSPSCGTPCAATFIAPPSFMNGVTGDDLSLKTTPNANCGTGYDEWYEFWTYSSSSTSQSIACLHPMTMNWAEFILEAPPGYCGTSGTYSSGGNYYCQLPEFNESGSALGFTGNLCNNGGTCRGLDTNTDNVVGYYIYQGTQDTTTSAISGGTSWTETWDSSVN